MFRGILRYDATTKPYFTLFRALDPGCGRLAINHRDAVFGAFADRAGGFRTMYNMFFPGKSTN